VTTSRLGKNEAEAVSGGRGKAESTNVIKGKFGNLPT